LLLPSDDALAVPDFAFEPVLHIFGRCNQKNWLEIVAVANLENKLHKVVKFWSCPCRIHSQPFGALAGKAKLLERCLNVCVLIMGVSAPSESSESYHIPMDHVPEKRFYGSGERKNIPQNILSNLGWLALKLDCLL
jgi:hypothetical protein